MPSSLTEIAQNVHVAEAPQRFMGLELGTRMTVLALEGGLLVHSPIAMDPHELTALGSPRWVLAPNLFHHLHVRPWADAGLEAWAAPGLPEKRPDLDFAGILDQRTHPFGDEVSLFPFTCFSFTNEIVVLHRPSRTLIVTDLAYNIPRSAPWSTRAVMRALLGYPGCQTTVLERMAMKRDLARREVSRLLDLPFDRLVLAHGDVIERDGQAALREAFRWLWRNGV